MSVYRKLRFALLGGAAVVGMLTPTGVFAQAGSAAPAADQPAPDKLTTTQPASSLPQQASAGTAPTTDQGGIRDIIVTARRTNENLQTTPVAVSAFDSQRLQQQQIKEIFQITQSSPGLSAATSGPGGAGAIVLAIRGNSQLSGGSFVDSPVGTYVDGVYIARPILGNLGLLDLDSVQVLRGTQGTLFGRNTTGGALVLTTVQPSNKFGGFVQAGYGNHNQALVQGAVTIPVTDELSTRFAGSFDRHGAYGDNPITGRDPDKVTGDEQFRGTVRYAPAAIPLTITVSGDFEHEHDTGVLMGVHAYDPAGLFALYPTTFSPSYVQNSSNFFKNYGAPFTTFDPTYRNNAELFDHINHPESYNRAYGFTGTVAYDLGGATIKSITAYRKSRTENVEDLDAAPANLQGFYSQYFNHQFSEELQLSGKTSKLDWIVGAIYFREGGEEITHYYALENTIFGELAPTGLNDGTYVSKSEGLYGQLNYHVTDRLRVTGGIRYTWDQREINRHLFSNWDSPLPEDGVAPFTCTSGPNAGTSGSISTCNDPNKAKFSYPAWLGSIDYELGDRKFVYLKTGGASLSGGFNGRPTPIGRVAFNPEHAKDVEGGFKGDFFDRKLRTNIAAFYLWRNGAQNIVNGLVNGGISQFTTNAGNIRSYGAEFEGTIVPWQGMEVTTSAAYLHSKYAAGSYHDLAPDGVTVIDRSNEKVTLAPKFTFNIGATQSFKEDWGTISIHGDYSHISSIAYSQVSPGLTTPALVTLVNKTSVAPGYGVFNGRLSVKLNSGLELALWGKNLGNKKYYTYIFQGLTSLGFSTGYVGDPRTFGGTATFKF